MRRDALLIGGLVLIVRIVTMPRTPWDADELRFPFAAMVALSIAASVVTAVALAIAFGPAASLLFSFSAAVLVHAPSGRPDALAWMFFALVFVNLRSWTSLPGARRAESPPLHGFLCAAAIACQPQFVSSGIVLFFAALILVVKERRERMLAGIAFVATLLPFAFVYGAPENLPWTVTATNVVRFTLHPWGSKLVALPLLVCVAIGVWREGRGAARQPLAGRRSVPLLREWNAPLEVLLWLAFVHTAVGIAIVDPADGGRWSVPAMMFVAVVASRAGWIATAIVAALSVWYAAPLLRDRVTRPSPPVEAARAIPKDAVVLFEREPWPGLTGMPLDAGLQRYLDRPDARLLVFARGNSNAPGARVFSHGDHDAYGKLTRNAYRRVALIPLRERYVPLRGVDGVERNEAGESWRWLAQEAELRLPTGSRSARVELRLPPDARVDAVAVRVNGVSAIVRRGETTAIAVPLSAPHLFIRASRAFDLLPPDTRRVAVQLTMVESR